MTQKTTGEATPKFKLPFARINSDEGVWKDAYYDEDTLVGSFKLHFANDGSQAYRAKIKALSQRYKDRLRPLDDAQRMIFLFCHLNISDWKGIVDEADKPVPFTPDNAFALFSDPNFYLVYALLDSWARTRETFTDAPDEAKN